MLSRCTLGPSAALCSPRRRGPHSGPINQRAPLKRTAKVWQQGPSPAKRYRDRKRADRSSTYRLEGDGLG